MSKLNKQVKEIFKEHTELVKRAKAARQKHEQTPLGVNPNPPPAYIMDLHASKEWLAAQQARFDAENALTTFENKHGIFPARIIVSLLRIPRNDRAEWAKRSV